MLVAMLRADGIAANMALLDTGPGADVTPELPGMNQFDHAIVYLPADGKGNDALWIDGTAEYAQVGVLPAMDQGRLALVIADGTTALTPTPEPKSEDDHLTELRDVVLADYGPAHIIETSLTHGEVARITARARRVRRRLIWKPTPRISIWPRRSPALSMATATISASLLRSSWTWPKHGAAIRCWTMQRWRFPSPASSIACRSGSAPIPIPTTTS
jgi:hypothetical protein